MAIYRFRMLFLILHHLDLQIILIERNSVKPRFYQQLDDALYLHKIFKFGMKTTLYDMMMIKITIIISSIDE